METNRSFHLPSCHFGLAYECPEKALSGAPCHVLGYGQSLPSPK